MIRTPASFLKSSAVLFAFAGVAACIGPPRTEFTRANGTVVYAISCGTMDDCAVEARKLCPNGHDVVPGASGARNTTDQGGIGGTPETRLLIECKVSP